MAQRAGLTPPFTEVKPELPGEPLPQLCDNAPSVVGRVWSAGEGDEGIAAVEDMPVLARINLCKTSTVQISSVIS